MGGEARHQSCQSPRAALEFIAAHGEPGVFHLKDFHEAMRDSAEIRRRLRDLYEGCLDRGKFVVITSPVHFIPEEVELRFAVLPIGDNFTMGARDAARAASFLKCKQIVGVHYDTFPVIEIDHEEAVSTFARAGVDLHLVPIGGSVDL